MRAINNNTVYTPRQFRLFFSAARKKNSPGQKIFNRIGNRITQSIISPLVTRQSINQSCIFRVIQVIKSLQDPLVKKVKFSHTRYRALGPELIPVYRQSARR